MYAPLPPPPLAPEDTCPLSTSFTLSKVVTMIAVFPFCRTIWQSVEPLVAQLITLTDYGRCCKKRTELVMFLSAP